MHIVRGSKGRRYLVTSAGKVVERMTIRQAREYREWMDYSLKLAAFDGDPFVDELDDEE